MTEEKFHKANIFLPSQLAKFLALGALGVEKS